MNNRLKSRLINRILKTTILVTITIACFGICPVKVSAGGINGDEARILSAISQVYRYGDGLYQVKGEYQGQVAAKLSEDGVNLTAGDVNGYLNIFYANIEQGVTGGYMDRVGDYIDPNAPAAPSTTPAAPQETPQEEQPAIDESENTKTEDTNKDDTETEEEITDYVDVAELNIDYNLKLSEEELKRFFYAEQKRIEAEEAETEVAQAEEVQAEEAPVEEEEAKDYSNASPLNNNKDIARTAVIIVLAIAVVIVAVIAYIKTNKSNNHKRNNR